ncbi:MAG: hypothetical protein LQ337_002485 [Flavoplaca oasis]|nr:MAG: hypothetical protein LQ337_002485 [Flavoplaca oasis]
MADAGMLESYIGILRQHAEPLTTPERTDHSEYECAIQQRLCQWSISKPTASKSLSTALKLEIVKHRRIRTTTSRVVEMDVGEILGNHPLPVLAIRMLFNRLGQFFLTVKQKRPELLSQDIDTGELLVLEVRGNQRQHFHKIRDLLGYFRVLLRHLADSDQGSDQSLLQQLGKLDVIVPKEAHRLVAAAAFGDTDEILSPPGHLREIWKPVGKERLVPGDGARPGSCSKELWRTSWRVRDYSTPPISNLELKSIFGPDATLASHAYRRLPYECGANKYTVVEQDPFVKDCTDKGHYTTAGPSGTCYRYLNLWLVLGGPREKLLELRLALAALCLGGLHHSLAEVMVVSAPILGQEMPGSLEEMLVQLVPHELKLKWRNAKASITPEGFRSMIVQRLKLRLG